MIDPRRYLDATQLKDYEEYRRVWNRCAGDGTHHWLRITASNPTPIQVEHAIPYQSPYKDHMSVCHPSGNFIAQLMAGGVHPPIEAHHEQKILLIAKSGEYAVVRQIEASKWCFENGPMEGAYVVDNRRCHEEIGEPMSYADAIEYCVMKDVPHEVWDKKYNQPRFWICKRETLPHRLLRYGWEMANV